MSALDHNHPRAWEPVTTLEQMDALDDDLVVAGYRAGMRDQPDYTQKSRDYWHGYMNGQVDTGRMPISSEQQQLARNTHEVVWRRIFGAKPQ